MAESLHLQINEEIPVIADTDVLVVGGGPGGLGAAVLAARAGARVILAEQYGQLGGMAGVGEVHPFMKNHICRDPQSDRTESLDRPVYVEWVKAMAKYLPQRIIDEYGEIDADNNNSRSRYISKDIAPLAAEDLCLEAGVRILYHHHLVRAVVKDGVIEAAVFAAKSGFVAIRAKNFVDATGDADFTILAGGTAEIGGPSGYCQPMTLCFKLDHVDFERIPENFRTEMYNQAKAEGKIDCPRENILRFRYFEDDVAHFNTTRVVKRSPVDSEELTLAELEARKQMRQIYRWVTSEVPGFENAMIRSAAQQIGVRESRRINGIRRIGREAFTNRSKFPDAIARCNYKIDIHNPLGTGTELENMPNTEYFEIPFGCIVPQGIKNLAVGGRPISVDHALHSSTRVMPPAISIGQAAGVAAAMAAASGKYLCDLDGVEVRQKLIELGADLK